MDAVHKGGVIAHLWRERGPEQNDLCAADVRPDINLEVADHNQAAKPANTFFAAAELPGFHVALHDVHTVLLIEIGECPRLRSKQTTSYWPDQDRAVHLRC